MKVDWISRRLGFRCRCAKCLGKFWQAKYGESAVAFRKRFESAHRKEATAKRFLVVSHDDNQQQWFYDTIFAVDEKAATDRVCKLRPYVLNADAISMEDLKRMALTVPALTISEVAERERQIAEESGVSL